MTIRPIEFRDPLDILIAREAETCKGCRHVAVAFERRYCEKGKKYGKRCKHYEEITTGEQMGKWEKLTLKWRNKGPKAAPLDEYVEVQAPVDPAPSILVVEQMRIEPWVKPEALDVCLECWKAWMGKSDMDLGAQAQRTLKGDGDGYGNDDTSTQRRENEIAAATDAMISSLRVVHRWAIYKKCSVSTEWIFPQLDFIVMAQQASEELEKKLRENIATRLIFD